MLGLQIAATGLILALVQCYLMLKFPRFELLFVAGISICTWAIPVGLLSATWL